MPIPPNQPEDDEALERLRKQLRAGSDDGLKLIRNLTDNPICALGVDESLSCVTVVWKRYATSTQLRFIHENILHLLKSRRLTGVLGDYTALPTIHAEDQRWIIEDWFPRAQATGLKAAASKWPVAYFGKRAVDAMQIAAPAGVELRSFEKLGDAREWLQSVVTR